jgi:cystathionine beta-lyase
VTCVSPSKSFNIAGLQIASIIARDETVRQRIDRAININEVCDVNPFGVEAAIAAYNEGEDWLLELLDYLKGNYDYLCAFFRTHLPEIPVTKLEGTYLVWTDCRALHLPSDTLQTRLLETTGLWLNSGTMYGAEGEGFLRWNIACPRSVLQDALSRFKGFVDALTTEG